MKTNKTPIAIKVSPKARRLASFLADQEESSLSLAPEGNFRDDQQKTLSAVAILDIASAAISTQPLFEKLEGVPDLQIHQKRSKSIAESWRGSVRPVLFRVNDTIINFSIEFNAFFDPLMVFADQLGDESKSKEAQANLIQGLIALMDVLKDQKLSVEKARDSINALQKEIFENESDLNADLNLIESTYQGDKGKLSDLKKLIESSEKAMNRDLGVIGGGAVAGVVGGLTIAVGVFMWIESFGASTPVILAGIALVAAGGAAAGYGIYDYNKSSLQKADAVKEMTKISKEIALTNLLKGSVSGLISHLDTASKALDKLAGAWGQLERDYENLISALQKTEGNVEKTNPLSFIVKANLNASKELWDVLREDAQKIKDNLLAPLKIDTSSLDTADKGTPKIPDLPTEAPKKLQRGLLRSEAPQVVSLQQFSAISEQAYRPWVESITQSLFGFSNELTILANRTSLPKEVLDNSRDLATLSAPALSSTDRFLEANEKLSGKAMALKEATKLDDSEIVEAAHKVLDEALSLAREAENKGKEANQTVAELDFAIDRIDASLLKWLHQMQADKVSEESRLHDAIRLRDDAQIRKEELKSHFWACLFGALPCAIVALEAGIRIKNAQSDIEAYNKTVASLDQSLSALLVTVNATTSLTVNAAALGKSIDGGLKAIQVLLSVVEGLRNTQSITPFVLRAHLEALAGQIEGISTVRLAKSATMLRAQVKTRGIQPEPDLLEYLQQFFASALLIHSSSSIVSRQPTLNNTENLLKENQALLKNHSLDWFTKSHQHVLSQLSALGAIGKEITILGGEVQKLIKEKNTKDAISGIEALVDSFSSFWGKHVVDGTLYKDTLALTLFNENIKNDQAVFKIVEGIIRRQFEGDQGQLARLEQNEKEYTEAINESLEDIVYNSTRVIGEHLAWAIVLGISLGLGQIEIAAAEAPTVMYLIKKGTNVALKKVSEGGSSFVQSQIKQIERKGDNVGEIIENRSNNLKNLSLIKSDIPILKILVNDVEIMATKGKNVLEMLEKIKNAVSRDISEFNLIKFYVQSDGTSEAGDRLCKLIEKWGKVSMLTTSLEQSYLESRFLPEPASLGAR